MKNPASMNPLKKLALTLAGLVAPAGREWHKPESTPDKAFFKLEAELK